MTHDHALPGGWRHVAAVRAGGMLRLYIDGAPVSESATFNTADYDLSMEEPLQIGSGQIGPFSGSLSDVRLYNRALSDTQVAAIFARQRI